MASNNDWRTSALTQAEMLVAVAEELERLTAEAWERARAAVERAEGPPELLEWMRKRRDD